MNLTERIKKKIQKVTIWSMLCGVWVAGTVYALVEHLWPAVIASGLIAAATYYFLSKTSCELYSELAKVRIMEVSTDYVEISSDGWSSSKR